MSPTAAVAIFTTAGMTFPLSKPGDAVRSAWVGPDGGAVLRLRGGSGDE